MIRSFYRTEDGEVRTDLTREEIARALKSKGVLWVDFFRATREEQSLLSEVFHFHPLAIEDCLRPVFRPKVDSFENYLFLIVHGPDLATRRRELRTLEVKAFLGQNYLVTFHRVPLRSIVTVLEKCERAPEGTLARGADFLLHTILDQMAENYMPILSRTESQVTQIEEDVLEGKPHDNLLPQLMRMRRDILGLRRVLAAQRDAVHLLARHSDPLISKHAAVYFRDVVGIFQRVLELTEAQHDALASIRDTHLSMSSNRTNETMKTMTLLATFLIPPTLISGIFGMNFRHMPELEWRYGYPFSLGIMAVVVGGMFYFFRRKKWL